MELEDFKNTWNQYDKKLEEKLRLNEVLLQKINLNNSKREMQWVLGYEILGIAVCIFVILFAVVYAIAFFHEPKFGIPSAIVAIVTSVYFAFALIRAKGFLNIDYYGSPVVQVQKALLTVKHKTLKHRKWEIMLLPLLVLPMLPVLFKIVHDMDIYQNTQLLIIEVVLILGLSYPLLMVLYKYFYDKKFKNAENLLAELKKFEKEDTK